MDSLPCPGGSQQIKTEFHPGLYLNKSDRYTLAPIYLQRTFPNFVKTELISMIHSPYYFFPRSQVGDLINGKITNNMREVDMNLSAKLGFKEDRFIIRPAISTSVGSTVEYAQWWEQVKETCPFWDPASSKAVMGLVTHGHEDSIAFLINVEAKILAIYHDEETDISHFVQVVSLCMTKANHQYTDLFESFFNHHRSRAGSTLRGLSLR